jgi:hypothetical protein
MEFYCDPSAASDLIGIAAGFGIDARIIGRVEALPEGASNEVIIEAYGQRFVY